MKWSLICFGKLKAPGLRDAADHYLKRLQPWIQIEEIELSSSFSKSESRSNIQREEKRKLLETLDRKRIPLNATILLDETGKNLTTLEWADQMETFRQSGLQNFGFCIGSAYGFDSEIKRQARLTLSLGKQTLAHELARVVLLEQIYRTWSVIQKHPYHNEG